MNQVDKIKQTIIEEATVSLQELGYYRKSTCDYKGWPIKEHIAMLNLKVKPPPHMIITVRAVFEVYEWLIREDPNNPFPKEDVWIKCPECFGSGKDPENSERVAVHVTVPERSNKRRNNMTQTIWKFSLEVVKEQQVEIPTGAEILTVQMQAGIPCMWALVDSDMPETKITIRTYGTGHPVDNDNKRYIGTYQLYGGKEIYHCFKLEKIQ